MQRFSHGSFEKELDNSAAGLTVALQRLKFQTKNKSDSGLQQFSAIFTSSVQACFLLGNEAASCSL